MQEMTAVDCSTIVVQSQTNLREGLRIDLQLLEAVGIVPDSVVFPHGVP